MITFFVQFSIRQILNKKNSDRTLFRFQLCLQINMRKKTRQKPIQYFSLFQNRKYKFEYQP